MKKVVVVLLCMCLLNGCSSPVFETLGDVEHVSATLPAQREICLQLPQDALLLTSADRQSLYICENFEVAVQTFAGGDLDRTMQQISGFSSSQLTIMETFCSDHKRYDMVWVATGEGGDLLCRGALIDDGVCHYTMVAMADSALAPTLKEAWNAIFASFCLNES